MPDLKTLLPKFKACCDHVLELFRGRPEFDLSDKLVLK